MTFLRPLRLAWHGFFLAGRNPVAPNEVVARYLPFGNWYSKTKQCAHPRAFLPAPADNETSVYRISRLSEKKIWRLGRLVVTGRVNGTLHGRAEVTAADVVATNLHIRVTWKLSRHVGIAGWAPLAQKGGAMLAAQLLAAKATLKLYAGAA